MPVASRLATTIAGIAAVAAACGAPSPREPGPTAPPDAGLDAGPVLTPLPMPTDPASYRRVEVAPGIHAFIGPSDTPVVSGNSLVVVGRDAALVVDTHQFPALARWEIAEIKALTDRPVRTIVNTHWHTDHWLGNADFLAAWPDAAILATASTRSLALSRGVGLVASDDARRELAEGHRTLATGRHRDGRALSANGRVFLATAMEELAASIDELATVTPLVATTTFADAVTIDLGGRIVHVELLGRGNTGGDAVVWIPDARVLATGDLVVSPVPFAFGSFIGEWITTLGKLDARDATVLVPGHGDVMRDEAYLHLLIAALRALRDQVGAAVAAGKTLEQAQAAVDLASAQRAMCGANPWCQLTFRSTFVVTAAGRAYREAKEGPLHDED